jgi:hypothetical protein
VVTAGDSHEGYRFGRREGVPTDLSFVQPSDGDELKRKRATRPFKLIVNRHYFDKLRTTSFEIVAAVLLTTFSDAFFSMTNLAAAT